MTTSFASAAAQNVAIDFTPLAGGRQIKIGSTAKAVTPFAGMASFLAWRREIGFYARVQAAMPFADASPKALPVAHHFIAFLVSVVLGASRFAHCDWLRFDSAFHALLGFSRFPGCAAILRFFARFSQGAIETCFRPLFRWLLTLVAPPPGGFSLDLDSTIFQREGSQEGAARGCNPRRPGRKSHHPLLAVLAEMPFVLHAWLRSGNTASGRGAGAFLAEALALLPAAWRLRCVRADSGFFDGALLDFLEERGIPYIIVAKLSAQVKSRLRSASLTWRELGDGHAVSSFTARLLGWKDTRRFVVVRERVRDDKSALGRTLLEVPGYTFRVWVTSRPDDAAELWRDYHQRATVEQRIEELKNDLHLGGFCTRKFFATEAAMLTGILAFNLLAVYQARVTPERGWRKPATLRAAVFVCGALLGRAGRHLVLRLGQNMGGLCQHKPLLEKACDAQTPSAPLLPRGSPRRPADDAFPTGPCSI